MQLDCTEADAPHSRGTTAAKWLAALPTGGMISHGHNGGEGSRRPTKPWLTFPHGTTATKGLAALPHGAVSHRATTAVKGLAALPAGGTPFSGLPPFPFIFPIPAIHISIIPKIPVISAKKRFPRDTTAAKGLATLPVGSRVRHRRRQV